MSYKNINSRFYGYCNNSIKNLYKNFPEFFSDLSLLITCLDSDTKLSDKKEILELFNNINCKFKIVSKSIFIDFSNVDKLLNNSKGIISHFDEIYLFDKSLVNEIVINGSFTTDGFNFEERVPSEFIDLFIKIGAKRYVSDGCGLNFVCESEIVASKLIKIS